MRDKRLWPLGPDLKIGPLRRHGVLGRGGIGRGNPRLVIARRHSRAQLQHPWERHSAAVHWDQFGGTCIHALSVVHDTNLGIQARRQHFSGFSTMQKYSTSPPERNRRVAGDIPQEYYLTGLAPRQIEEDAGCADHHVTVYVTRPGLRAGARSGFFGETDDERLPKYATPLEKVRGDTLAVPVGGRAIAASEAVKQRADRTLSRPRRLAKNAQLILLVWRRVDGAGVPRLQAPAPGDRIGA